MQTGVPVEQTYWAVATQESDSVQLPGQVSHVLLVLLQYPVVDVEVRHVDPGVRYVGTHTGEPDVQSIFADDTQEFPLNWLEQSAPCVHVLQVDGVVSVDALHTPVYVPFTSPQGDPAVLYVNTVHPGTPVLQSVMVVAAQSFVDVQVAVGSHDTHVLAVVLLDGLQVPGPPVEVVQVVPAGLYDCTVQVGTPVPHCTVADAMHGSFVVSVDVQSEPWTQATHVLGVLVPAGLQVPAPPVEVVQVVPAALYDVARHCSWPVEQSICAVATHGSVACAVAVQSVFAAQAVQVPAVLQTPCEIVLVVHGVPGAAVWVTAQTGGEAVQSYAVWVAQGLSDVHVPPQRSQLHWPRSVPPPALLQSMV